MSSAPSALMTPRLRVLRRPKLDVAFHVPSVANLVSSAESPSGGGAETQVYLIARELAGRGLRVGLVCHATDQELPLELDGIQIIRRPRPQGDRRLVGALLESAIVVSTILGVDASVYVQRIASFHTGLVALAARLRRRRFVYSSASVIDFELASHGRAWRDRSLFRMGTALASDIVVQTEEQAALCRARFGRVPLLIPSISEPASYSTAQRSAFLWIGRADPCKRPLDFVALAIAVPEAQFRMVLLREGPLAGEVGEQVDQVAAAVSNLTVLGGLPRTEVGALIDQAVAVVSTSEYEGMPNVFLEAWARGVPTLALHHDPDGVIEREGVGFFLHGSGDRLADQARVLWGTGHDQEEIARRCREYVDRSHAPSAVGERWMALLTAQEQARA